MSTVEKRKEKYTPKFYRTLKLKQDLTWREVPFVCIQCGKTFNVEKVKPKMLPKNCSEECRNESFDPSIGAITSSHLLNVDWKKVRVLVDRGKTGPEIAKTIRVSLATLHKYIKKKMGVKILNKMVDSGKRRRKQGQLAAKKPKSR